MTSFKDSDEENSSPKSVIACIGIALVVVYFLINSPRRRLDRFLRDVTTVDIDRTRLDDWRKQVEREHLPDVAFACNQQTCTVSWRGNNKLVHKLRLAPLSTVEASVDFKDGIASKINIWTEINDMPDAAEILRPGTGATVRQTGEPNLAISTIPSTSRPHGDRHWAVIEMDSCISPEDRARAFAINTACLTTIGGCKTAESIIPQIFGHP
jgi:hypothetical protein